MDLLPINVCDIPEGGLSVAISLSDEWPNIGKKKGELEGKIDLAPLEVHNVIDGGSWQDELLKVIDDPYISFHKGFSGWITLFRSNQSIILKGWIVTSVEMSCSRCTELFEHDIDINFKSVLTRNEVKDKEVELTLKELEYTFFSGEKIDLGAIVMEHISLTLPVKPLCDEDCLGLCGVCGKNQNLEKCDCKDNKIDIRFEKLKYFNVE